jgi:hypothetical protein
MRRSGDMPISAASPVSDKAVVKARRVIINGQLPDWRIRAEKVQSRTPFASQKRLGWQWRALPAAPAASVNFA